MTNPTASQLETDQTSGYANLAGVDRAIAEAVSKPRWLIYAATLGAVILAWVWLSLMVAGVAGSADSTSLGPGMGLIAGWLGKLNISTADGGFVSMMINICTPQSINSFGLSQVSSIFAMWMVMSVAMMLPSAAPMLRTYGDIADVAVQKYEKVVPLFVLTLGYLAAWTVFSALATLFQISMVSLGTTVGAAYPVQGIVAGLILIVAGLYQFSSIKNACLEKCRNPFSILFGLWTTKPWGVFKLGVQQGVFCVGCCWALMLVMLVVGTMNLAWMAFFTLFTVLEKSGRGKVTTHVSGAVFLTWGSVLAAISLFVAT